MAHPLDGARLKVIRAQEHLNSLKAEIGMYLHDHPYEIVPNEKIEAGEYTSTVRIRLPPPLRLSTIIGDCVTNARAALDYVMWELATRYFQPPFNRAERNDRRIVTFPIYQDPTNQGYVDHVNRLTNRRVPADAIDRIKAAQPHNRGYESLWWLHELVNTDKHRAPLLTIGRIGNFAIAFAAPSSVNIQHGGSLMIGRGVLDVTAHLGATGATIRTSEMHVNAQAAIYVAWQDVAMPKGPVERTLEDVVKAAADIIPGFDAFL